MRCLDEILDVDLDFYNQNKRPLFSIQRMLDQIRRDTPAAMVLEHQQVLPFIRLAVKSRVLTTPFTIHHIDEHHDFYGKPNLTDPPGCGDFMYHIHPAWCKRVIWTRNTESCDEDFDGGEEWCHAHKISIRKTYSHLWRPKHIGLALFTISPDYLSNNMLHNIVKAVEMITKHFRLKTTFKPKKDEIQDMTHPKNWERWLTKHGQRGIMVT